MPSRDGRSGQASRQATRAARFSLSRTGGSGHPYCMTTTARVGLAGALALGLALGCTSSSVNDGEDADGAAGESTQGSALRFSVGPDERTFVELATPAV